MLDKNSIIAAVRENHIKTFSELAQHMGIQYTSDWEEGLREVFPGLDALLERNDYGYMFTQAQKQGLFEEAKEWRYRIIQAAIRYLDAGIPAAQPVMAMGDINDLRGQTGTAMATAMPKTGEEEMQEGNEVNVESTEQKPAKKRRTKKAPVELIKVPEELIDGDVMKPLVAGGTGEDYCGRQVIMVTKVPGIFGTPEGGRERQIRCTLHNGIINQSTMKATPTPYWAVLDAASELKNDFTREEVIAAAVRTLLAHGVQDSEKACSVAWDVLKNHQHHPRKRDCGMGFMVDTLENKKMSIRSRDESETNQFFEEAKIRSRETTLRRPGKKTQMPTEERPVSVIVEDPR